MVCVVGIVGVVVVGGCVVVIVVVVVVVVVFVLCTCFSKLCRQDVVPQLAIYKLSKATYILLQLGYPLSKLKQHNKLKLISVKLGGGRGSLSCLAGFPFQS